MAVQAEQPLVWGSFAKRWTEANASWARMVQPTNFWDFNSSRFLKYEALFRDTTQTTLYWTQFHASLPDVSNASAVAQWAGVEASFLGTLVNSGGGGGMPNLQYYCFSNEEEGIVPRGNVTEWLTLNKALRRAMDDAGGATARVVLVGTDFYDCSTAFDGLTGEGSVGAYSCHHYGAEGYDGMASVLAPALNVSFANNHDFFLAEFGGPSCHAPTCRPPHDPAGCNDACAWWDTPAEVDSGLVLAEKVLSTINLGGQSTGYWTFEDPLGGCPYWGLCRWNVSTDPGAPPATVEQLSCRPAHYSHGLLSKFLRGPAQVFQLHIAPEASAGRSDPSPRLIATFVVGPEGEQTLVVLNLASQPVPSLDVSLPPPSTLGRVQYGPQPSNGNVGTPLLNDGVKDSTRGNAQRQDAGSSVELRFYRYTVAMGAPPLNPAGDLPAPSTSLMTTANQTRFVDPTNLPAASVTVYTSVPAPTQTADGATGFDAPPSPLSCTHGRDHGVLEWNPVRSAVYYRVTTDGGVHVWSTVDTTFNLNYLSSLSPHRGRTVRFAVQSVDRYSVASTATLCA